MFKTQILSEKALSLYDALYTMNSGDILVSRIHFNLIYAILLLQ